ncbi:HIT family protein [Paenibacillus sp. HWE-109]|uniref:HIT family protein n=1 Tax=Paenibacillus sp. HWE-109 TaxID=1306526 RepID=UPI001EDD47D9|nr:HIT family protein [Paenibacillus sp. HWE-109]
MVYENDDLACLLDIAPLNEGHLLILPKKHFHDLDELDEHTAMSVMSVSALLSKVLKEVFQPDGITILQNGGKFNDLGHYHMHVFPRYETDGFAWVEPTGAANHSGRLEETKVRIASCLNAKP